ncbi:unnamed protein product [Amoebophrya sp. A120]|nr:unnamed protein product [Amoebophrya sp. A120]|eukprot:GSA120T00011068001.1
MALEALRDKSNAMVIDIVKELEKLEELSAPGCEIHFNWVPSHLGNYFNDFADALATRGLRYVGDSSEGRKTYEKVITEKLLRRIVSQIVKSSPQSSNSAHPDLLRRSSQLGEYQSEEKRPRFVDNVMVTVWLGVGHPGQLGMGRTTHNAQEPKKSFMTCPVCQKKVAPSTDHLLFRCEDPKLVQLRKEHLGAPCKKDMESCISIVRERKSVKGILNFYEKASQTYGGILPTGLANAIRGGQAVFDEVDYNDVAEWQPEKKQSKVHERDLNKIASWIGRL